LIDVPAAVVCAACGQPDCAGECANDLNETTHGSGVIAIVPWERPGLALFERLWSTARLATLSCEAFFARLPEGEFAPALRFAILAELTALAVHAVAAAPLLWLLVRLLVPGVGDAMVESAELRSMTVRATLGGIPILAAAMVAFHVLHGIALDYAARKAGSTRRRQRGVRFGLYACGWDLVTLPLGLLVVALRDGTKALRQAAPLGMRVPAMASYAYLRGVHQLTEDQARRAARFGTALGFGVAFGVTLSAIGALALVALLF
jgi:hypothetical protein